MHFLSKHMREQKFLKVFYKFTIQNIKKFTGKVGGNILWDVEFM